jgi:DNA repair exonuclease SbcCD ATPase subunit
MNYENPFIRVTWEDTAENFTPEKIRRVKTYFQNKYNSKNVQVVTKNLSDINNTKLKSLDVSDNITDKQYQKNLMKDFIKENSINIKWELVDRLDNKINSEIDKLNPNKVKYNKWYIKKIKFSNFLSFGENNEIDYTKLDGITVIESTPKNFGGKSTSTVDLLMFLFFNSTTKTKTNGEIFNKFTDKDEVLVSGEITIDGEDYVIERKVSRKKTKTGEYTITNKLEFYKINSDGTILNLSGEQRRETEEFISSAIGTEEDFLSTILTTGYNLEQMIESKATARGQILTRFLGLENLKIKEEKCKEIYNDWSKKLTSNTYNIVQLESDNVRHNDGIENSEKEINRLNDFLEGTNKKLQTLESRRDQILSSRNNDIDQDLIRINPSTLEQEINTSELQKKEKQKSAGEIIVKEPSEFYLEEEHTKIKETINDLVVEKRILSTSINSNEKLIEKLEKGTVCPTCSRPLEDVDHTSEIDKLRAEIKDSEKKIEKCEKDLVGSEKKEVKFTTLKKEYDEYERNKLRRSRIELEIEQKQIEIDNKKNNLKRYEDNKKKLDDNKKIDAEIVTLRTQIDSTNGDIRQTNTSINNHTVNINSLKDKITVNNDLITKIKSEEELLGVFKTYLTIYGKNGISKVILKNMIPLLNIELHRLLSDSCYFILELNINDKNEVEFLMIDNETRVVKPLNSGSGYERTISSLAIRSVLTKISSLPKPNIVVMDEVFGKIADENLEMVGEFFKKIKNYFEHIIVISHNTLIRNWSDNLVMINKNDNISSIEFITTKIS